MTEHLPQQTASSHGVVLGGSPQALISKEVIDVANRAFEVCASEKALAGLGSGIYDSVSDLRKNGEITSPEIIAGMLNASLDVQKGCLAAHPLADLSRNYRGVVTYGDPWSRLCVRSFDRSVRWCDEV